MTPGFWRSRRVLLTGHTGFKGAWLALWLNELGADVCGASLDPPSDPNLFEAARVGQCLNDVRLDVRDAGAVSRLFDQFRPDVVFHLAAQALVRPSYAAPVETFATNVMGTLNVLEAMRHCPTVRGAVIVTSDKCYENSEHGRAYREDDPLGGHDPYSASKACAEIVTGSYRRSFLASGPAAVATVRAGNVIGGGDWGRDRLVPDLMRAFMSGVPATIRSPGAVRPWQHVLEPLRACIELAERLSVSGQEFAGSWNLGPDPAGARTVGEVVELAAGAWGGGASWTVDRSAQPHEATLLSVDASLARTRLGWSPRWSLDQSIVATVRWYRRFADGGDMREETLSQIRAYGAAE